MPSVPDSSVVRELLTSIHDDDLTDRLVKASIGFIRLQELRSALWQYFAVDAETRQYPNNVFYETVINGLEIVAVVVAGTSDTYLGAVCLKGDLEPIVSEEFPSIPWFLARIAGREVPVYVGKDVQIKNRSRDCVMRFMPQAVYEIVSRLAKNDPAHQIASIKVQVVEERKWHLDFLAVEVRYVTDQGMQASASFSFSATSFFLVLRCGTEEFSVVLKPCPEACYGVNPVTDTPLGAAAGAIIPPFLSGFSAEKAVDLTQLACANGEAALAFSFAHSPATIKILLLRKDVPDTTPFQGQKYFLPNRHIECVSEVVPLNDLYRKTIDGRTLAALALYQGLKTAGKV